MLILEALLLTLLLAVLVAAGYTDCKYGKVRNRLIIAALSCSILADALYYGFYAGEYFASFLYNLAVITLIAFLFYSFHLWAAGDSKLFFIVGLLIPGRHYSFWDIGAVPSFMILIMVFSFAFLYVITESFVIGIREKNLHRFYFGKIDFDRVILSYLSIVAAAIIIGWSLGIITDSSISNDVILSVAINFFVVLSLIQLREHVNDRVLLYTTLASWSAVLYLVYTGRYQFELSTDLRSWGIVFAVMFIRMIAEKYNYQMIPTQDVRAGQILSSATILSFKASRVQGLPTGTTEDLRSRITPQEAESIKRWETSKHGKPFIIIVRKIPFAIFIGLGTASFIILGVVIA